MNPVSPNTGAPEHMYAEEQEEYKPLAVAHYRNEKGELICLMRYQFSAADIDKILAGEDCWLSMLGGVIPHTLGVGKPDWIP